MNGLHGFRDNPPPRGRRGSWQYRVKGFAQGDLIGGP